MSRANITTTANSASPSLLSKLTSSIRLPSSVSGWAAATVGVAAVAAAAAAIYKSVNKKKSIRWARPLHWVFKVSDLEKTVNFYEKIFGLKVQRHEEFEEGCAATCNGPYSGWWSKTMMSLTTEEDFSIELTYNYGVDSYRLGNDLAGIHVAVPGAAANARQLGVPVLDTDNPKVKKITNPDGQVFFLHEETVAAGVDPFLYVSIHTEDISKAADYYVNVLGMQIFDETPNSVLVGYDPHKTKIQLVSLPKGEKVDHADSFGRIAFGNFEVIKTYERVKAAGDEVINPPISLDTPDKASVVVTILRDRDGNEICMVDDGDFRRLCITKPGDEIINWSSRAKRIKAQQKFAKAFGGK